MRGMHNLKKKVIGMFVTIYEDYKDKGKVITILQRTIRKATCTRRLKI
jgi:hypothetical protein